jgi:predicted RecB family nuclease
MSAKITREVLEGYLSCKYKGHLKLAGQAGTPSDYEAMMSAAKAGSREAALAKLVARFGQGDACRGGPVTAATLKQGPPLLADIDLEGEGLSLRLDALKRADGRSKLGEHHYLPVLHVHGDKVGRQEKLLLAVLGLALAQVQRLRPAIGLVARGPEARLGKVRLDARLYRQAQQVLDELKRLQAGGEPPRLTLNKHCQVCEFRQRCRKQAEEADDISLLGGVGEKELKRYHRKGIFTLTQLSCTFRPRKRAKRVKWTGHPHYAALQALAIREKKVHVYGTPELPRKPVQVFLDAEGSEDGGFVYLLGVLVVEGDSQQMHSFWADTPAEEVQAFDAFLDLLEGREDFALFHYGGYERKLLRRMRKVVKRKGLVEQALGKAVNVVSVIHASVYFPTFSNGLKEVGRHLGCTWTEEHASGLQSLVWRARWEHAREQGWKDKLVTYNAEDCAALKKVTEFVQAISEAARSRGEGSAASSAVPAVTWADEVEIPSSRMEWCRVKFAVQDFDHVNRCAYFDYQREKVYLRTSKAIRSACQRDRKRRKRAKLPVSRTVELRSHSCPRCKGKRITRLCDKMYSKLAYDLKFTAGGIRRQVIRCTAARHRCEDCWLLFLPKRYKKLDKYQHGLKSWAMYQHVVHRISFQHLEGMFEHCFGLRVSFVHLHEVKTLMARRYRSACERILERIAGGRLAHADETHVNLKKGKGYVWALTNLEDVLYLYKPSREADFLQDLLRGFKGVLVTDFYTGYDSLPCEQQKCLVHLIRDFNGDLLGNPYDEEFKSLAAEFGKLLRSIVATIDRHGLKKWHLHKHKPEVTRFFRDLEARVYRSELAESYQRRLLKYQGKLFTFLDHDGIPWNNNNAEHAVKAFAYYRRVSDGMLEEGGLSDYLVLLSVYQTCKYRGVSFLKFLLSGEDDVAAFCQRGRKKKRRPRLEVYPEGFPRRYGRRPREAEGADRDGQPSRVRWKPAILAFLRGQGKTGVLRSAIREHCIALIRAGTLVTAASADDRQRVDHIISLYLYAMKQAGEVARKPGKGYFVTARGLAWLKRHPAPAVDIRQPVGLAPGGQPVAKGRTIAIGDIHGCSVALRELLGAIAPTRQDTIVTLGDYIDHGPDSNGVILRLLNLIGNCKLVPLKGDHEEMLLAAMEGQDDLRFWLGSGGDQTLRSYAVYRPRDISWPHCSFLNRCENYHETDTHLFVHAGYRPDLPLKGQPGSVLRRRSLEDEWPGPHFSGKVVVLGHTPQKGGDVLDLGHLVCIDTNCHGGGWLTALDVGSGRYWQANEQGQVREGRLASAAAVQGAGSSATLT